MLCELARKSCYLTEVVIPRWATHDALRVLGRYINVHAGGLSVEADTRHVELLIEGLKKPLFTPIQKKGALRRMARQILRYHHLVRHCFEAYR